MKILIACEESQVVCKEFRELGHEAYSCDIQECSGGRPEWHILDDAIKIAYNHHWDMMIAHPPCTYLSYCGNHWFNYDKFREKAIERNILRHEALLFFFKLYDAPIKKICIENPMGYVQTFIKESQIIHPYYFGFEQTKRTLLWLKNLKKLNHSKEENLFESKTHAFKGKSVKNNKGSDAFFGLQILKLQ